MYPTMIAMFIVGVLVELFGVATVASGADQRHWGSVAVFLGAVLCVTSAIMMDGLR